jgi:oxygen-independent coproporphyrinogen-3 oxidase
MRRAGGSVRTGLTGPSLAGKEITMSEEHKAVRVTPELLARYNRPGPRYTSYPTAPQFHTSFGPEQYVERLEMARGSIEDPLSLYFHIPFCDHRCLYCGCHVVITRREDVVRKNLDHLKLEVDLVTERLGPRKKVIQLHWGGGTPTHLTPEQMRELYDHIVERFEILPDAEVAIEIDPRVTTTAHVDAMKEFGFNRLSMGVQDFTPQVQEVVERNQTYEETEALFRYCRSLGFTDFNIDLIYGLPKQSVETFEESLRRVVELGPDRVAVYSYAHVPWIRPHQRKIDAGDLPDTGTKFGLFSSAVQAFTDAGYIQIGMDHFARPDDELAQARLSGRLSRNFMGYTVKAAPDMVAFGISGIGEVAGAFAQNEKKLSDYYKALGAGGLPVERGYVLDDDDRIRRFVILSLMCNFELKLDALQERFGVVYDEYFRDEDRALTETIDPEFYQRENGKIRVTPMGQLFIRNICMVYDRYLGRETGEGPIYSKTI